MKHIAKYIIIISYGYKTCKIGKKSLYEFNIHEQIYGKASIYKKLLWLIIGTGQ